MEELFEEAKEVVRSLEARLASLKALASSKDAELKRLIAELGVPTVWITGPARRRVKAVLLGAQEDAEEEEESVHPFRLDTKYYVADVFLHVANNHDLEDNHHAIILALTNDFDKETANSMFDAPGEVRLCICDDPAAADWCVEQGVEWVEWSDASRILDSLSSTMWPNMVTKNAVMPVAAPNLSLGTPSGAPDQLKRSIHASQPVSNSLKRQQDDSHPDVELEPELASKAKKAPISEEEQVEMLERLMSKARTIRDSAATLNDAERRNRAAQAAEEMAKLLGIDDDDDDDE